MFERDDREVVAKLVMAVALVMAGFGVGGAVGGITIGTALTLLLAIFPLRRYLTQRGTAADTREIYKYLVPVAVAVLCSAVLTNIDVIFARHYLDFHEAGLYSAASMISKIILFLPSAIAIVLFPKVSDAHARTAETHRILRTSIIITLLLSSLIALAYVLVPDSIMGLLYGAEYSGSGPILQILGLAMVFFGISNLFMIYGLATDGKTYIWILALFSGLEVVLILLFHDAPGTIALNLLVVSVAITVISAAYLEYKVHGQSISPFKR